QLHRGGGTAPRHERVAHGHAGAGEPVRRRHVRPPVDPRRRRTRRRRPVRRHHRARVPDPLAPAPARQGHLPGRRVEHGHQLRAQQGPLPAAGEGRCAHPGERRAGRGHAGQAGHAGGGPLDDRDRGRGQTGVRGRDGDDARAVTPGNGPDRGRSTPCSGQGGRMSNEDPPGVDLARLRAYLDRELPGTVTGPLTARLVEGGRSNLTYLLDDGTGRWVLRRPPLGHVLPTAHDMSREHRVISGLHGTAVPVPRARTLCTDEDVLGAPFYVMDFVPGSPLRTADQLRPRGPERTKAIADRLVETLVERHAVDPAAVGLGDFGRPEGFLERQLRRWSKQLAASRSRDVPGIDELHERLAARVPASPAPAVVHGDYRLDNVLVGEDDRINAVLDWEMSTLGDPLTDVALLLAYSQLHTLELDTVSDVGRAPGHP